MRKYMLGLAAVIVAVIGSVSGGGIASAQAPENYNAEYSSTNFYANDVPLTYHFSGLDTATSYSWLLQAINSDGSTGQAFEWKTSLGSATATVTWSGSGGDFDDVNGLVYEGALRVIDSWGQTQGIHYTTAGCSDTLDVQCGFAKPDWLFNGSAINPAGQRFGIGKRGWVLRDLNDEDYFHTIKEPGLVTVDRGETIFLHYSAGASVPTDRYYIYSMEDSSVLAQFQIQDLIDYNTDVRNSVLTPWHVTESFVVLNTDGSFLPNMNQIQESAAFEQGGSFDNPHKLDLPIGAYDYEQRTSVNIFRNDGESVLLVSAAAPVEWAISNNQNSVGEAGNLRVELESATEAIYDGSYSDHRLDDSVLGIVDAADYEYQNRRHYAYQVSGIAQDGVVATWSIYPVFLNQSVAGLVNRRFEVDLTYDISNAMLVSDRVENTLAGFGMDSPLGRGLGMLLLMAVGMLFVAKNGGRTIIPFGLVYLVVGGGWLALGLGDTITTVLFGITAIFIIFIMINSRKSEGSFSG